MANNTIILKPVEDIARRYEEGRVKTAKTISPGMLIEVTSDSTLQPHATTGGSAEGLVAVEDALQGKTINDSYAAGDLVRYNALLPGTTFQGILKAAEVADPSKFFTSAGDGTVRVAVVGTDACLGKFEETMTPGANAFIKLRWDPAPRT